MFKGSKRRGKVNPRFHAIASQVVESDADSVGFLAGYRHGSNVLVLPPINTIIGCDVPLRR